jgi:hypothetical protein
VKILEASPVSERGESLRILGRAAERVFTSSRTWLIFGLLWAAFYSFADRYTMNPDGMSYVDIASNAVRNGPAEFINGYWSPGYPAVLAVFLAVFRPSPEAAYPVVHFANFCIFALVTLSFAFFLKHWIASWGAQGEARSTGAWMVPFGFSVFLWHSIELIGVAAVVPDLCVAGFVFLAAGVLCRLSMLRSRPGDYASLGVILGLAYYFKAAMFPIGLLGLTVFWIMPPTRLVKRQYTALAALTFLVVTAPLAVGLSFRSGKPTIGEVGHLSYVWYVNRYYRLSGWTEAGEHGTPEHAPRKLMQKPELLEFAEPVSGTFPLWYDPAYWYAGVKAKFDWQQQWAVVRDNSQVYWQMLRYMNALLAGAFLLGVLALRDRKFAKPDRHWAWQLAWPLSVVALYWLVYIDTRYVAPFCVVFWLAVYGILMPCVAATPRKVILLTVSATMLIPSLVVAGSIARFKLAESWDGGRPAPYVVAAKLQAMGFRKGDRVAIVGEGFEAYFAQIAGLKIVAQVPSEEEFQRLDPSEFGSVAARLSVLGVKALIAKERPLHAAPADWQEVTGSAGYSILRISGKP